MSPIELFFPTNLSALTALVEPEQLMQAAAAFPGGAIALVFALFWAPVGPGIPAGVLLARHIGLSPAATFSLYALSDVLGACVCHPLYGFLRRFGGHAPMLARFGRVMVRVALIGTRPPRAEDVRDGGGLALVLFRIGAVSFIADLYSAGLLIAGLPVPRLAGWGAALVGDLAWFAVLLATSIATAQVTDRSAVQLVVMIVVMLAVPWLARRLVPSLREKQSIASSAATTSAQ